MTCYKNLSLYLKSKNVAKSKYANIICKNCVNLELNVGAFIKTAKTLKKLIKNM